MMPPLEVTQYIEKENDEIERYGLITTGLVKLKARMGSMICLLDSRCCYLLLASL